MHRPQFGEFGGSGGYRSHPSIPSSCKESSVKMKRYSIDFELPESFGGQRVADVKFRYCLGGSHIYIVLENGSGFEYPLAILKDSIRERQGGADPGV